jgi:NADPH:quinone reductase-like Zn-dependent oxidoreductase
MRLRRKILIGIGSFVVLAFATLAIVLSYESRCPAPLSPSAGQPTMRAIVHRCYGTPSQALRLETIEKPTPGEGQLLIRVRATSVNPAEWFGATGQPRLVRLMNGIGAPKLPRIGFDMAGVVEAVGPNVTLFKAGDEVYGGVGGAFSEYVIAREKGSIVLKPENLSFEEAAAIPIAAVTALQGLRDNGHIAAGQHVLINGASGGVGTYAVQIAKAFGAEVTGVCSTRNVELVKSAGADHVIDYTQVDFTAGNTRYDLILDNVGNHSYFKLAKITSPDGIIVTVGGSKSEPFLGTHLAHHLAPSGVALHRSANAVLHREDQQAGPAAAGRLRAPGQAAHVHRSPLSTGTDRHGARLHRQPARAGEGRCHRRLKPSRRWSRASPGRRTRSRVARLSRTVSRRCAALSTCIRAARSHPPRSKLRREPPAPSPQTACRSG